MGDDIGSGSLTDCHIRSDSDLRQHTQQSCTTEKIKTNAPELMSSTINYHLPMMADLYRIRLFL